MSTVTYTPNPTSAQCAEHLEAGGVVEYDAVRGWRPTCNTADDFLRDHRQHQPQSCFRLVHAEPPTETPTVADAPIPYVPAEGAVICLARDVPDGWETRGFGETDFGTVRWASNTIVEARPKPEPLVALMVPRSVAESYANMGNPQCDIEVWAKAAARAALEAS